MERRRRWDSRAHQLGGQVGSGVKLLSDVEDYAQKKQDAQEYRDVVQLQVRKINDTLRSLDEKRKAAVRNMDGYRDIVEAIDMLCAKKPVHQVLVADAGADADAPAQDAPATMNRYATAVQAFSQALGLLSQFAAQHPGRASAVSSVLGSAIKSPGIPSESCHPQPGDRVRH